MKKLLAMILGCFVALAMTAQTIITESKDTITPIKQQVQKTIKVGVLAYKDSVIKYDTTILLVKKYVPPNPTPGNILPTADAGPDMQITAPASGVVLVGDGGDEDGDFTVQWSKVSGSGIIVNGTVLVNAKIEQLTPGTTVIRLTITGDKGERVSDDMTITVLPAPTPGTVKNYPLSFTPIPFASPDVNAPGRGAEQWHDRTDVRIPTEAAPVQPLDVYYRFTWNRLEGSTAGSYNWSYFDGLINAAINKRQKFSFGIMTLYTDVDGNTGGVNYDGAWSAYPQYLHNLMKAEAVKDWRYGNTWVPNWNSQNYIDRLRALNQAVYDHIMTGNYKPSWSAVAIPYKNVINAIDIRGYGNWGEWHSAFGEGFTCSQYPAGAFATVASLKKIVDAHTQTFRTFPLVAMIAAFDANWLNNTCNPAEIAHYILTGSNEWGPIGWRRDQWGATDSYLKDYLENNNRSFNGVVFKTLIMDRWKTSPITGEPPAWNPSEYTDLERQIRLYHATSFGNGNYGGGVAPSQLATRDRIRAASKAAGYRLQYKSANISTNGNGVGITMNWENVGISPTYENWNVIYELIDDAGVVRFSHVSSFKLKLFLPTTTPKAHTDAFTALGAAGDYKVNMKIVDPSGYRAPLVLAMPGRNADGSYTLIDKISF